MISTKEVRHKGMTMEIKAVKFTENGFMMKSFAFGGGLEKGEISPDEKMPSCLQNYLIDTGSEVILVDTGLPAETPDIPPSEGSLIYVGKPIQSYMSALKELGYSPEQVTKILVTHKHSDHTGELRSFPNAKIYISRIEADAMKLRGDNIIRVDFSDGAYHNFEKSQKIANGIYYIFAPGHTLGNSIVIVESEEGIYYLIHGDVTYTDEALHENRLSVIFENLEQARDTLNRVREFVKKNPTTYLSTHTPQGYQNLESRKIMQLSDENILEINTQTLETAKENPKGKKWICSVCGYEHCGDEPPEKCPICDQSREVFKLQD